MNQEWCKVYEKLDQLSRSNTGMNNEYHLRKIFEVAEAWGLDPSPVLRASKSNLCTIIKCARLAITNEDKEALVELFEKAAKMTNVDLRLDIVKPRREIVYYEEVIEGSKKLIHIVVNHHQFERIKTGTILQLDFHKRY